SRRLAGWMEAAVQAGAKIVAGGKVDGAMFEATLLEKVGRDQDLYRKEAFGPVALLESFERFEDALARVNDSDFGLQAGVFTDSLSHAHRAWDSLEVGGVVINDVPSFRVDNMPYGGVKDSGLGREGIRYAIEDMTEPRLMVVRQPG
ncbi:aldehyde dehydrogenase family protein, partial [Burkholderia gladioli]|nr:aldehyde dehydrogenase family protein [Burkholderia gladioli]